jgi:hypothetical protein
MYSIELNVSFPIEQTLEWWDVNCHQYSCHGNAEYFMFGNEIKSRVSKNVDLSFGKEFRDKIANFVKSGDHNLMKKWDDRNITNFINKGSNIIWFDNRDNEICKLYFDKNLWLLH